MSINKKFLSTLALVFSLAVTRSAMGGFFPGGGLRDHGHTAPGDGGALANPSITGGSPIFDDLTVGSTTTVSATSTYDDFTDGDFTATPAWSNQAYNASWAVTSQKAVLTGSGANGNGILFSTLTVNTDSIAGTFNTDYMDANGIDLILSSGCATNRNVFSGYKLNLKMGSVDSLGTYCGVGEYIIAQIYKDGASTVLGTACNAANVDWRNADHTITLSVTGGTVSADIDSSSVTLSGSDSSYTEGTHIAVGGLVGASGVLQWDDIETYGDVATTSGTSVVYGTFISSGTRSHYGTFNSTGTTYLHGRTYIGNGGTLDLDVSGGVNFAGNGRFNGFGGWFNYGMYPDATAVLKASGTVVFDGNLTVQNGGDISVPAGHITVSDYVSAVYGDFTIIAGRPVDYVLAFDNAGIVLSTNTQTLPFASEQMDTSSTWASNIFTTPYAGWYSFKIKTIVNCSTVTASLPFQIYANASDATDSSIDIYTLPVGDASTSGSWVPVDSYFLMDLATSETVTFQISLLHDTYEGCQISYYTYPRYFIEIKRVMS